MLTQIHHTNGSTGFGVSISKAVQSGLAPVMSDTSTHAHEVSPKHTHLPAIFPVMAGTAAVNSQRTFPQTDDLHQLFASAAAAQPHVGVHADAREARNATIPNICTSPGGARGTSA